MNAIVIPLNGWAAGERKFHSHADLEFFQTFDNTEILDADVDVEIRVVKKERKVEAELHLSGTVTVPCDRCLEPLAVPVEANPSEVLKPESLAEDWDLSQAVYDYICLSLPLQRVHPEGECNPDTVRFLGQEERTDEEAEAEANSPFAALKGLFDSK
ncbi:MAG: DUF177 domain-containing protein [Bacteroidales bacterium]|jgi:uncharacterized metal-binding protein YceD (DUF177 family)|nr:DUF177 domain-containing protein [Bacteroidales bacterium]